MNTLADDLQLTLFYIDTPEKWKKGVTEDQPKCMGESMAHMMSIHQSAEFMARKNAMINALGFSDVEEMVAWNDADDVSHRMVVERFWRAIIKAQDAIAAKE